MTSSPSSSSSSLVPAAQDLDGEALDGEELDGAPLDGDPLDGAPLDPKADVDGEALDSDDDDVGYNPNLPISKWNRPKD